MDTRMIWRTSIAVAALCLCFGTMEGCHLHVEPSEQEADGGVCTDGGGGDGAIEEGTGDKSTGKVGDKGIGKGGDKTAGEVGDTTAGGVLGTETRGADGELPDIDFTIQESPVDTERYDARTDRAYKEAFLKAITGQAPIRCRDQEGSAAYRIYRELLTDGAKMGDEAFLRVVRQSDFFYQDYDGDGLPELIIDTEGPCVLKYHPKEEQVELYQQKEPDWRLLGAGQMFADRSIQVDSSLGSYYVDIHDLEAVDMGGGAQVSYHWRKDEGYACQVTLDGQAYTVTGEEAVTQLDQAYIRMIKDAPHPMSFAVLFGDGEDQGYLPGEEQPPRYLLEETAALPLNEESGKEWELYRSMMEGDFSLVEDERWGGLQGRYEDDLERDGGRCSWSYLLMDFDEEGTKELMIRTSSDLVNATAYFRYEDGHIKMWEGSYMSADAHYHTVPLINGRILGVEWYQGNRAWWITRPDPQHWGSWEIREKFYSKTEWTGSEELKEGDAGYHQFQDYYHDGRLCGPLMDLSPEEWEQIEEMVEGLLIPEEAWKPCSVFTPKVDRPEIPGVP